MLLKLAGLFAAAFWVGLSGALVPGPLLAVTVEESARRGARAGPLIVLGHMILEAVLVAALAIGLAGFLTNSAVLAVIAFAGGGMMCWMGQDMLRTASRLSLQTQSGSRRRMHPVTAGVLVSLSNPYWTIWWATVGMQYVVVGLKLGIRGVLVFFAGHILADLAWYTFVSAGIARGKRFLTDRIYQGIIAVCGTALIGFGLWFLWTGLSAVRG